MSVFAWLISTLLLAQVSSAAQDAKPSRPASRWDSIQARDYWMLGGFSGAWLTTSLALKKGSGGWNSSILFDDTARNMFRATTPSARNSASSISDIGMALAIASPFVVDAGIIQGLQNKDWEGSYRTAFIGAESFAFTMFMNEIVKRTIARQRPFQKECATDGGYAPGCGQTDAYRSFYSGHTSMAFTGAGLLCLDHSQLDLLNGNAVADKIVCASAVTAATATGLLRIVADRHYASDVIVGAAVGLFSGYFMPGLFHSADSSEKSTGSFMIVPGSDRSAALVRTFNF